MKCKYCLQEIGQIKEVYIALCKLSKHKYGIVLTNEKGEFVGWVSETRMYCKNCRPSAMYTARNWTLATT